MNKTNPKNQHVSSSLVVGWLMMRQSSIFKPKVYDTLIFNISSGERMLYIQRSRKKKKKHTLLAYAKIYMWVTLFWWEEEDDGWWLRRHSKETKPKDNDKNDEMKYSLLKGPDVYKIIRENYGELDGLWGRLGRIH